MTTIKSKTLFFLCCLWTSLVSAQQQDCVLWYTKPAQNWNEALPIGNGRLGAMVYGGCRNEIIQLNEESLWAGSKSEANADAAAHLPRIQQLLLDGEMEQAAELSEKHMRSNPLSIRSYQSFGEIRIDFTEENAPNIEPVNSIAENMDMAIDMFHVHAGLPLILINGDSPLSPFSLNTYG